MCGRSVAAGSAAAKSPAITVGHRIVRCGTTLLFLAVQSGVVNIGLVQVAEGGLPKDAGYDEPDPVHMLLLALAHRLVLCLNPRRREAADDRRSAVISAAERFLHGDLDTVALGFPGAPRDYAAAARRRRHEWFGVIVAAPRHASSAGRWAYRAVAIWLPCSMLGIDVRVPAPGPGRSRWG